MSQQKHTRSFLAVFMLVLFAFSITPQRTLHDIFKCHKGEISQIAADGKLKISKGSFHCSCQQADLQVVFIDGTPFSIVAPVRYATAPMGIYTDVFYEQSSFCKSQRGPPSLG